MYARFVAKQSSLVGTEAAGDTLMRGARTTASDLKRAGST
jgi:hypothetical protein